MITNFSIPEDKYNVDFFINLILKDLKEYDLKTFNVGVSYPYSLNDDEKQLLKKEFQFNLVKEIEKKIDRNRTEKSFGDINILIDYNYKRIEYIIMPIFIYGIYNKYSRELPQTIDYCFKCRGKGCSFCNQKGILRNTSIQEIIEKYLRKHIDFKELKFHGAGREDIDVLMLGNGREFIVELEEPKKREVDKNTLEDIEKDINENEKKNIKVNSLRLTDKEMVGKIKNEKNFKEYLATVECEKEIDIKDFEKIDLKKEIKIKQFTPKRVSKRRALITRERTVEILDVEKVSKKKIKLRLKAEAGLYVKEFISGENKKTNPSISEIIQNPCKCIELDVILIYR